MGKSIKKLYIDTETTGKRAVNCGLTDISGILEIDGKIEDTFTFEFRPRPEDFIDPEALAKRCINEEALWSREMSPEEGHKAFVNKLGEYVNSANPKDKYFFHGYNPQFDKEFIDSWCNKLGDPFFYTWIYFPIIDVAQDALKLRQGTRHKASFGLEALASTFHLYPAGQAHNCAVDIDLTYRLHKRVEQSICASEKSTLVTLELWLQQNHRKDESVLQNATRLHRVFGDCIDLSCCETLVLLHRGIL